MPLISINNLTADDHKVIIFIGVGLGILLFGQWLSGLIDKNKRK